MNAARPLIDRIAYITGGSSGIGAATVEQLSNLGATIVVIDIQEPKQTDNWIQCDLADRSDIVRAVSKAQSTFGPAGILINDAGVAMQGNLVGTDFDSWDRVLQINLTAAAQLISLTMPEMISARWGRIVNIASGTAVRVHAGMAAYAASKAGLVALTKVAAVEGARHGITANTVAPGLTDTPMTRRSMGADLELMASESAIANPMGKVLYPPDIAGAITFFCLPTSWAISGQLLHVSAGSVMP